MPKISDWKAPAEQVEWLRWAQSEITSLRNQVDRLTNSSGNTNSTQTSTLELLSRKIVDLDGRVSDAIANLSIDMSQVATGDLTQTRVTGTWTKSVSTSGSVTADAGITSTGVFNLDVSSLPGARRTDWVNVNGQIGYAPSSITKKENIRNYEGMAENFLACQPVVFEYVGQVAIRDDPENPNYDPDYKVPQEVGHVAEWLMEQGLDEFVFYDDDGVSPAGINYAEFAAVGMVVVGRDHESRLQRLEDAAQRARD
jgi:hypothetical protein